MGKKNLLGKSKGCMRRGLGPQARCDNYLGNKEQACQNQKKGSIHLPRLMCGKTRGIQKNHLTEKKMKPQLFSI